MCRDTLACRLRWPGVLLFKLAEDLNQFFLVCRVKFWTVSWPKKRLRNTGLAHLQFTYQQNKISKFCKTKLPVTLCRSHILVGYKITTRITRSLGPGPNHYWQTFLLYFMASTDVPAIFREWKVEENYFSPDKSQHESTDVTARGPRRGKEAIKIYYLRYFSSRRLVRN